LGCVKNFTKAKNFYGVKTSKLPGANSDAAFFQKAPKEFDNPAQGSLVGEATLGSGVDIPIIFARSAASKSLSENSERCCGEVFWPWPRR
jgi:hypothetical protein